MTAAKPWATAIAAHLAMSRRADLSWEDAKRAALNAHPAPGGSLDGEGWAPSTVKFAFDAFKDGYLRRGAGKVGALAVREHLDPSGRSWRYVPDEPVWRSRCGTPGCDEPVPERGLCAEHAAVIDAIPPYCNVGVCTRDVVAGGQYCGKHQHLAKSNLRGSNARSEQRAA